jgi:competence ComEA-like helix-hairpin-helix protein
MLNLTQQERQVILFLTTVALVGMGINFLAKRYTPVKTLICFEQNMGKIDLNKANKENLVNLSGIGEKLAERIIEYRKERGDFKDTEELKNIKGISDSKYERLKGLLFVQ